LYLKTLKLRNFRKYEKLEVNFTNGLNLLVGENDSGKTAVIDAIKYVLHTKSYDFIRPSYEDFYLANSQKENARETEFIIECTFEDFKDYEAKNFLEWLSIKDNKYILKVALRATRKDSKVFYDLKAGENEGTQLTGEAREYLRVTYLKPLRDAESELTPKRGSRLSQILNNHEHFVDKKNHRLKRIMKLTNQAIDKYFTTYEGKDVLKDVNTYLEDFSLESNPLKSLFQASENSLKSILEKLSLKLFNHQISDNIQGLGSHNLLYISAELLLLTKEDSLGALKLALVEEIEAHLHPQTQIRLIESIQELGDKHDIQFILTSHSPNLASKVKLQNLILCREGNLYPMGDEYTQLAKGDYYFLERFLDSIKANLFFANGVILVEGDAENILLPTLAKIMNRDLSRYGVSIVSVGSTAFLRYANIFLRKEEPQISIPVSLITDVDVKPDENGTYSKEQEQERKNKLNTKESKYSKPIQSFIAPYWTLEYTIALSCLSKLFYQAVYIAWKSKGKDYVYSDENKQKFITEAANQYCEWEKSNKSIEEIAYEIYQKTLLDKQVSKAVVAQIFSQILNETDLTLYSIHHDKHLKYLVDAIEYATTGKIND